MQNYFLTAPGKITHSCATIFFFFTDDTILSSHSSAGAAHGHFSDLKLQRCSMLPFAMQAGGNVHLLCGIYSENGYRKNFPLEVYVSKLSHFSLTLHKSF
ncbi:Hypothetical predicted protein [Xyrichtys novacula]|uniref:Uncharacterized protein n=1 Tax=Xyrichtys novacula TaxID=13765 RepID=A0AAV1FLQ5_XYRNO|nr:Hypothetical predicted protein [Xyrichtys novacula]